MVEKVAASEVFKIIGTNRHSSDTASVWMSILHPVTVENVIIRNSGSNPVPAVVLLFVQNLGRVMIWL